MPIFNIVEYSETDSANIDISGIGLSDATLIDQLDDIARAQMGALARFTGADTIASAATTSIGALPGQNVTVTGTTTITSFGTVREGIIKFVTFSGILTLTHNATSLILKGGANITTAAGDTATFVSEGSGNWRCLSYDKASGEAVVASAPDKINAPVNLSLTVTVNSNALTVAIKGHDGNDPSTSNPVYVPFRSATAGSGDIDVLSLTGATSLVVSSGSTLGLTNATPTHLVVVGFNDGGTLRLGIINPTTLPVPDALASSTAEGGAGAADSAGVFYTGAAVTSKPYVVLGYIVITEATAGIWASAPTTVTTGNASSTALARDAGQILAWVTFDGTGTLSVIGSSNVSSVTDNGTGDYTINFSTPMPDAKYAVQGTGQFSDSVAPVLSATVSVYRGPNAVLTTSCRIQTSYVAGGGVVQDDFKRVSVMFVR